MHDVVVIGAGPAGTITAQRLAARGLDVLVLEEHADVGRPVHCTGLVSHDVFAEFSIPTSLILAETGDARFWGSSGASVPVRSERVRACVIDRSGLDAHFADEAQRSGARLRTNARVEAIHVDDASVRVAVRGADVPVVARACVLACGAQYRFHKSLGLGVPDVFLQSAQLETPFPPPASAEHSDPQIEVMFGRGIAPGGFGWVVPFTRGNVASARIGVMSESDGAGHFAAHLARLCVRTGLAPDDLGKPRQKMLPLAPTSPTFSTRVVAVGDAAGLVKPTTGGGIYYGLISGVIAAEVLGDALTRDQLSARDLRRYETTWRRRLGGEIRAGLAFRRAVAGLQDDSIDALIELARVDGVVPLLHRTASFNWHRKAATALLSHPEFRRLVLAGLSRRAKLF